MSLKVKVFMTFSGHDAWVAQAVEEVELPCLVPDMEIGFKGKEKDGEEAVEFVRLEDFSHDTTGKFGTRVYVKAETHVCENIVRAGGWALTNYHPEFGYGDRKIDS